MHCLTRSNRLCNGTSLTSMDKEDHCCCVDGRDVRSHNVWTSKPRDISFSTITQHKWLLLLHVLLDDQWMLQKCKIDLEDIIGAYCYQILLFKSKYIKTISSGVSHSDGSCVLGRIHSDVSSNIPKKVYHIVTDNFVNLLHISYAWLYKTECWGRKFHAFSFNSHRNCKIFMTNFNFTFDTICVPYIFRKSIFGWNCDHDTPLCDTPLLEDTPLCDTPDDICKLWKYPARPQRISDISLPNNLLCIS